MLDISTVGEYHVPSVRLPLRPSHIYLTPRDLWVRDEPYHVLYRLGSNAKIVYIDLSTIQREDVPVDQVQYSNDLIPCITKKGENRIVLFDATHSRVVATLAAPDLPFGLTLRSATVISGLGMALGYTDPSESHGGVLVLFSPITGFEVIWDPGPCALMDPFSIRDSESGGILVADPQLHVVLEVSLHGQVKWQFGRSGCPGSSDRQLRAPTDCAPCGNGAIITDSLNDRIIQIPNITEAGEVPKAEIIAKDLEGILCSPRSAVADQDNLFVADWGNQRVIRVSNRRDNRTVWGSKQSSTRLLAYPRSVVRSHDTWLVADTNHHRVIRLAANGSVIAQYPAISAQSFELLHWPRCAVEDLSGNVIVADGINRRLVWFTKDGKFLRELVDLYSSSSSSSIRFGDPHDIRILSNGNLLCTDSSGCFVVELTQSGEIVWSFGLPSDDGAGVLKDPHQAIRLGNQVTLIVDSLHDRILTVLPNGKGWSEVQLSDSSSHPYQLRYPRAIEMHSNGSLIADGNGEILAVNKEWKILAALRHDIQLSSSYLYGIEFLEAPTRYIRCLSDDYMCISDFLTGQLVVVSGIAEFFRTAS